MIWFVVLLLLTAAVVRLWALALRGPESASCAVAEQEIVEREASCGFVSVSDEARPSGGDVMRNAACSGPARRLLPRNTLLRTARIGPTGHFPRMRGKKTSRGPTIFLLRLRGRWRQNAVGGGVPRARVVRLHAT
jgi:hypothetical protein